jgi:hypothetical protein
MPNFGAGVNVRSSRVKVSDRFSSHCGAAQQVPEVGAAIAAIVAAFDPLKVWIASREPRLPRLDDVFRTAAKCVGIAGMLA